LQRIGEGAICVIAGPVELAEYDAATIMKWDCKAGATAAIDARCVEAGSIYGALPKGR
jgi:hypothetical protein